MSLRICYYKIFLSLVLVAITSFVSWAETEIASAEFIDHERAVELAKEYFGTSCIVNYSDSLITEVSLHPFDSLDINVPFFSDYFKESNVWHIHYDNVMIKYKNLSVSENAKYARDFNLYIDAVSGALIEIRSEAITIKDRYAKFGTAAERRIGYEKAGMSLHVPDVKPLAFSIVLSKCYFSPYIAAEIEGVYVRVEYDRDREPRVRWQVNLRGTPPLPVFGVDASEIPPESNNTVTIYCDPVTGEMLSSVIPGH